MTRANADYRATAFPGEKPSRRLCEEDAFMALHGQVGPRLIFLIVDSIGRLTGAISRRVNPRSDPHRAARIIAQRYNLPASKDAKSDRAAKPPAPPSSS